MTNNLLIGRYVRIDREMANRIPNEVYSQWAGYSGTVLSVRKHKELTEVAIIEIDDGHRDVFDPAKRGKLVEWPLTSMWLDALTLNPKDSS